MSKERSTTILIAGAGQLGSRYLQGLVNCQGPLQILVYDISEQSLEIARKRWEKVFNAGERSLNMSVTQSSYQHKVSFLSSYEKIPIQIDIAIVATNADVRVKVVNKISKSRNVRYWILEKILAQSEKGLDEISSLTRNSAGAWVNTPRRMMTWLQKIHKNLRNEGALNVKCSGPNWGLACNGIHFLDLVSWWTGERLIEIDSSGLDLEWIESKRKDFFDITGKIKAAFSNGSTLTLEARLDGPPLSLEIDTHMGTWKIDESNGVASKADGFFIHGKIEMQSSMTSRLVDNLRTFGDCYLTKLSESTELHRVLIRSLLRHWNYSHNTNTDTLPIT